jgi:poly(A) polymerase/tRNA nucleotidyltransferase (CCA-adding enzyme)
VKLDAIDRDPPALRIDPPAFLADPGLQAVLAALPGARLVGGCVRDALAGLAVADIDLATPLPPQDAARALAAAGLKSVPTGIDHGTITAIADHRGFEVTTLRRDVQTDGRHAVVAYTQDWREDAARRDFTINAMSMAPDGAVFDYFGGIADLRAGRVRFVGEPAARIAEDYLRVLRFFRFFARYAGGPPDAATLAALAEGAAGLPRLSPERVWSELKRILAVERPDASLALMRRTGVLAAVLAMPDPPHSVLDDLPADPLLRLAALCPRSAPAAGDLAERLRMSTAERDRLIALQGPPPPADADEIVVRRLLADIDKPILLGRAWLARLPAPVRSLIAATQAPVFPLHGRDLVAAGIPPGPALGAALRDLRAAWLAGGCLASAESLLAQLPPPAALGNS